MTKNKKLTLTLKKEKNRLDGIECFEPVNLDCLNALLNSDLLINNLKNPITRDLIGCEEKLLTKYKNAFDCNEKMIKVVYKRVNGMSFGRCNPVGAIGLFNMRKVIRHTLCKKNGFVDWDISNAHPNFLLQICKANGIACESLNYYVNNRNIILKRIMDISKCIRDDAKELFIRLLYFGSFKNWLDDLNIDLYAFQNDMEIIGFINNFSDELKLIGERIIESNPVLVKEIQKHKQKNKQTNYNLIGSVVSFYLQEWEVRVLECMYNYCEEKGYLQNGVCALCADGIMLSSHFGGDESLLPKELNEIVKSKIGFNLVFENKILDEALDDEFIKSHKLDISKLDQSTLLQFNTEYFNSLFGYARKKIYFENFVCKVMRPDPTYIYREIKEIINEDCLQFYSERKITESFKHLGSGEFSSLGIEIKFMTKWLYDEDILIYNEMDFMPFNERVKISNNLYNLFRGFNPKIKSPFDSTKKDKLLKPFKELGIELCGGDISHFNYLYSYLADIIQNPNVKNPIAFIIKGKQGTGKNMFLNAFGNILGKHHYITSSNPKDFFGDYAEGFYHKLLVNMNECEGKDTFDFEGRIKSFITEDTITLNRKFVQPITISNLARLIIFTNKSNPIPIDVRTKDRRYVVFETTDKYLDSKYGTDFWKSLLKHFNRDDFIACLYDDMNNLDISKIDWRSERPITNAYIQMCKLYVPTEVLFLENKFVKGIEMDNAFEGFNFAEKCETDGVCGMELFKDYTNYCKEFGFYKEGNAYQKNIKCFYSKLIELELPMIVKKPQNKTVFHFNPYTVLNFMKERKWIDRNDDEIMVKQVIQQHDFTDYFDV
jgi:hypothetical protein